MAGSGAVSTKRRRLAQEIARAGQRETPYGPVIKTLEFGDLVVPYMCPFALLWSFCDASPSYASFLSEHLPAGGQPCRIALYVDEVCPGNALRPDHARAFYSFFWLLLDFPDWFRSSAAGWYDICVIKQSDVNKVEGGVSAITARILSTFWSSEEWNFERLGVRVAGPRGTLQHVRANFACFIMDERAEKFVCSVKGSSGSKLCMSCRNCVGRIDPSLVPEGLQHFSSPGLDGFEPQTYESFCEDFEYLRAQSGTASQANFAKMQQALGIVFDLAALPYSGARSIARIPETRFCDWMHNLCASGGVAQYQINQFCIALSAAGISVDQLDIFLGSARTHHAQTKLKAGFFKDRTSRADDAHIRAFAGEVLTAMNVLHLFCKMVLEPINALGAHVSLVVIMSEIFDILCSGDRAAHHVPRLQELLLRFHRQFLEVSPRCCKPKLHYMHHTPQQIGLHRRNLACFAPERKHQANKQALNFIYRNMEVALASRNADEMLRLAQHTCTFQPA